MPHPGKVLDFLLSWKVLENIWEISRASPGQNSEATFPVSRKRRLEGTWASATGGSQDFHGTDKIEGGLMVLFFSLVFFVDPPGNFSAYALGRVLQQAPVA